MFEAAYLQSIICPVGRFIVLGEKVEIQKIYGTGFFIGDDGLFLTARHVIETVRADVEVEGGHIGLFPMQPTSSGPVSFNAIVLDYEIAPHHIDAVLGRTGYRCKSFLKLGNPDVDVWQDIGTTGYPVQTIEKVGDKIEMQQRAHKGYIQRVVPAQRIRTGPKADSFELSFAITQGMSGAPLFIHQAEHELVIGICVGSHQSRVTEYENIEIHEGQSKYSEKLFRIEEFGMAHDVRALIDWTPKLLGGMSLGRATNSI